MANSGRILFILILVAIINSCSTVRPHTKGLRPRRGHPRVTATTAARNEEIEEQFMTWVKWVGTLNHSLFETAKNKVYPSFVLTVDKNPAAGDFTTIQAAIDSLPTVNSVRIIIRVNPGIYTEKVNIPPYKSFITVEGAGADRTVVQWGDTAQTLGAKGQAMGTFNSATFAINSPYFVARNITFK